jgi:ATP-dependent RNA helicase RhlE
MHRRNGRPSRHKPRLQPAPVETNLEPPRGAFTALIPALQRAIAEEGYSIPTPVQEQAIPALLEGRDLMASAPTGTGKTAAFTLPILQHLIRNDRRPASRRPRVLVLAPTRELAAQIGDSIRTYGKYLRIGHVVIHGGVGYGPQISGLLRGPEILVATPGRLLDLMQGGSVHLDQVEIFVLDEVDRMLDMGFIRDIRKVIAVLPQKRQTLFLSATLPGEAAKLAQTLVHNPVRVSVAPETPTLEKITQKVLFVEKKDKDDLLATLLSNPAMDRVIVFTRMKHTANKVTRKLLSRGVSAVAIHGNKSQNARTQALDGFKTGEVRALEGITHVVNYDLPREPETYVHRIGRTARAGSDGDAISFCSSEERGELRDIERTIRKSVPVDTDHAYHSERSQRGSVPAPGHGRGGPRRGPSGPNPSRGPRGRRPQKRRGRAAMSR